MYLNKKCRKYTVYVTDNNAENVIIGVRRNEDAMKRGENI